MSFLWGFCQISIKFLWDFFKVSMSIGYLWVSQMSMGYLWDIYGVCIG